MMHEKRTSPVWRFARWPLMLAVSAVLFFVIGVSTVRETYHTWQVDQEIKGLQTQVDQLESKKMQLLDTVQRLNSDDEMDKQARARLGLKKPGERVIVLPDTANPSATGEPNGSNAIAVAQNPEPSNPQKWFHYFFPKP